MRLSGSCHCGSVRFSVESGTYYPFNRCYCSICRKTTGAGGYAINLKADAESLDVEDNENVKKVYHAQIDGKASPAERHFCSKCGSHLWLWDPRWPELLHPLAAAIDTDLPKTPETVHLMLGSKASWVDVPDGPDQKHFTEYPEHSIDEWHRLHGLKEGETE